MCVHSVISDVNRIVLILRRAYSSKYFIFKDAHGKTGIARLPHASPTGHGPE